MDVAGLVNALKNTCYKTDANREVFNTILLAWMRVMGHKQYENQKIIEHVDEVKARMKVISSMGISINISRDGTMYLEVEKAYAICKGVDVPLDSAKNEAHDKAMQEWAEEHLISNLLMMNAEKNRHTKMKADLHSSYLQGMDNYPNTTTNALKLLQNYVNSKKIHDKNPNPMKGINTAQTQ